MVTKTRVVCPYADKCVDVDSGKCTSCLNNEKRSYYRPDYWYPNYQYPYYYDSYYPYWEPWKTTWTTTTNNADDLGMLTTSYYTQA